MSKTVLVRFDLAQLRLLHSLLLEQEDRGEYWGNREHFQNRLIRTALEVNRGIALLELQDAA